MSVAFPSNLCNYCYFVERLFEGARAPNLPADHPRRCEPQIPIVMAETGDPVGLGFVASLPRPGGNVTGMTTVAAELAGKSVQLIREMLPSARRVTALANATDHSQNRSSNRSSSAAKSPEPRSTRSGSAALTSSRPLS